MKWWRCKGKGYPTQIKLENANRLNRNGLDLYNINITMKRRNRLSVIHSYVYFLHIPIPMCNPRLSAIHLYYRTIINPAVGIMCLKATKDTAKVEKPCMRRSVADSVYFVHIASGAIETFRCQRRI